MTPFLNPLYAIVHRVNAALILAIKTLLLLLFSTMIIVLFANVLFRYIFNKPLFWVTEITCYLLVYIIFIGGALALFRGEHVRIASNDFKMPMWLKRLSRAVAVILNLFFVGMLIVFGGEVSLKNMSSYTGLLPVPMGAVYMAAPISGICMLSFYLEKIILLYRKDR